MHTYIKAQATTSMKVGSDAKPVDLVKYPRLAYTRVFAALGKGIPSIADVPLQVLPHVSFKDPPTATVVNAWLATISRPVYLTYHHEPEGDLSPTDYRAGWATLAKLVQAHHNGHFVTLVEIFTRYAQVHGKQTPWGPATWQNLWSGHASMMGWDCYLESTAKSFLPPATFFAGLLDAAKLCAVPYIVPELGSLPMSFDPDGSKEAAWLTACATYLKANGCRIVSAWDNPAGGNYVLTGKPLAAWQKIVATQ